MKDLQAVDRIFSKIETALAWVGGCGIMVTMFYVSIDILARLVFKTSIGGGTTQLVSMITVLVAYSPLAYTLRQKGHVTMTVLTDRLKGRAKILSDIWVYFFCTLFFLGMLYITGKAGFLRAYGSREVVEASFPFKLYLWYGKIGQPIGTAVMMVTSFLMFIRSLLCLITYGQEDGGAGRKDGSAGRETGEGTT